MQLADTILMVRPVSFGYNAETARNNFFQEDDKVLSASQLQQKALSEFDNMVTRLQDKGIEVVLIDDTEDPPKPDAVFPNNWLMTAPDGVLSVFPMFAMSRRAEKRDDILQMMDEEFEVNDVQDWSEYEAEDRYLEGTGSMVVDHDNCIIYACLSPRTSLPVLERFAASRNCRFLAFHASDQEGRAIYHTNVMMCLADGFAVICADAIRDETERIAVKSLLESTGRDLIPISQEQLCQFAGNMLQLKNKRGDKYLVMSQAAFDSLEKDQLAAIKKKTGIIAIAVPTIERIEGGSVRCMMAEIFLKKKK